MEQSDCVIINIVKGVECPMCGNDVTEKNMTKSCPKNIPDHHVCEICSSELKSNGFGDGCVYCGHRVEKETNVVIARAQDIHPRHNNVVIIQQVPHSSGILMCQGHTNDMCYVIMLTILLVTFIALAYAVGIIIYSISQSLDHRITGEDHTHEVEWSLKSCVSGYAIWLIVGSICVQLYLALEIIYERCCFPCGEKLVTIYKRICRSQSRNQVSVVE